MQLWVFDWVECILFETQASSSLNDRFSFISFYTYHPLIMMLFCHPTGLLQFGLQRTLCGQSEQGEVDVFIRQ